MSETPKSNDAKSFKIGDLVWAKVKGYPFWPGEVADVKDAPGNIGKPPKNAILVRFFQANNHGWAQPDSVKDYEKYRETHGSKGKGTIKLAIKLADERLVELNGGQPLPILPPTPKTPNARNSIATPQTDSKPGVFLNKSAVKKPTASATPVQRDYSRTPFKKEKRNFENAIASSESPSGDSRRKSTEGSAIESKRVKIDQATPRKRVNISPVKHAVGVAKPSDDDVNDLLAEGGSREMAEDKPRARGRSASKPSNLKFGFIGLGTIGQQVLKHLMQAGHDCTIWNRTPSKCKEFERDGAVVVKTPGDVIRETDITFCCLTDSDASSKIFFGNCGVSSEINPSKGYVELTSLDPLTSMDIEALIKQKGGRYLEAPLICSVPRQLEEGKCIAMTGGDRSLFDDCTSCFAAICAHVYFLSESAGNAARLNILVASLFGNMMGSLVESLSLVERMGLNPKDFVEIIANTNFASSLIESKAQSMLDSTLVRDIPIDHIRRDLTYMLTVSNLHGFATPITAATNEMFKQKKHHYY